jgi:DNA-binding CsgD family transcriptional regulator
MAGAAGITEDQMAYLRAQGLTDEQIALMLRGAG